MAARITFAQGAARHAHSVRSEERDLTKPENQDLRDALFYVNGRRYYDVPKLEIYEQRLAKAPHPPKRAVPKLEPKGQPQQVRPQEGRP